MINKEPKLPRNFGYFLENQCKNQIKKKKSKKIHQKQNSVFIIREIHHNKFYKFNCNLGIKNILQKKALIQKLKKINKW